MRLEPEIQDAPDAQDLDSVQGEVRFDHVSFQYNNQAQVLRDISLTIPAGENLPLLDHPAAGKPPYVN